MPELPEVENFAREIHKHYAGLTCAGILLHRRDIRFPLEKRRLEKIFAKGTKFLGCRREGKRLLLETSAGTVHVSLGMTGAFSPHPPLSTLTSFSPALHEHVTLLFENGSALAYTDPRRFGYWQIPEKRVVEGEHPQRTCDPLQQKDLEKLFLSPKTQEKSCSIKQLLMNQNLIGGLGNIYVLEALHRARISPLTPCHALSLRHWRALATEIPLLLKEAIKRGGSSIATYRTLNGKKGSFQSLHRVYDKEGESCARKGCHGTVVRIVQAGRGSWYCPICQE